MHIYCVLTTYVCGVGHSCIQLFCDPMISPGFSVHGIFQARILKRIATSYFRGSSWLRTWTHVSCVSYMGGEFFTTSTAWEACNIHVQTCVYICKYTHIYMYIRRRQRQPTPALLPGKSHGWRSLVGCSPWGCSESDTTERLYFHFSLSCIGQGNGNTLQYSCLKNPRDGGAWWAAVYGVAQSRTRLKWLSSIHVYTEWRYITVFLLRKLRLYFFNVLHIRQ